MTFLGLVALMMVGLAAPAPSAGAATTATASVVAPPGVSDSIVRLYLAVFDRLPDPGGRTYWVDTYQRGVPLATIATSFTVSDEWATTYGIVDDDRFVELLYANVLERPADPDGLAYWRATIGESGRSGVLVQFSESDEFVAKTATVAPVAPVVPFPALPPNAGAGRRIVYSNGAQRVWLVNADESIHDSYLVSGRRNTPRPGHYAVFSKSPKAWAGHDGITMDHMVRFARGRGLAIGFHSIPSYRSGRPLQAIDQLGTYRSAGCVRQAGHKAQALFAWAPIGTPVIVTP